MLTSPHASRRRLRAAALCSASFAVLSALAAAARAQTFTFTDVANSTNAEFAGSFLSPVVNSNGVLAFNATRRAGVGGGDGVFTASDTSAFTRVALSAGPNFNGLLAGVGINDGGTVVFRATRAGGESGLYTATSAAGFTAVTTSNSAGGSGFNPVINNAGQVAFNSTTAVGGQGIFTATTTAALNPVARVSSPEFSNFGLGPAINGAGRVAFSANRDAGGQGLYTATSESAFTTLATTATSAFTTFGAVGINDTGTVAFYGGTGGVNNGIYTASGPGLFTPVATSDSPEFSFFGSPIINNLGTVAFDSLRDAGDRGLYVALTGIAAPMRVIKEGDALFGSTLTGFGFYNGLARDANVLAISYTLANGTTGVARINVTTAAAAVPEPGSAAFALAGLGGIAGHILRRRRQARRA
jgi:MYXO-CTERM domain-containing protein